MDWNFSQGRPTCKDCTGRKVSNGDVVTVCLVDSIASVVGVFRWFCFIDRWCINDGNYAFCAYSPESRADNSV